METALSRSSMALLCSLAEPNCEPELGVRRTLPTEPLLFGMEIFNCLLFTLLGFGALEVVGIGGTGIFGGVLSLALVFIRTGDDSSSVTGGVHKESVDLFATVRDVIVKLLLLWLSEIVVLILHELFWAEALLYILFGTSFLLNALLLLLDGI